MNRMMKFVEIFGPYISQIRDFLGLFYAQILIFLGPQISQNFRALKPKVLKMLIQQTFGGKCPQGLKFFSVG